MPETPRDKIVRPDWSYQDVPQDDYSGKSILGGNLDGARMDGLPFNDTIFAADDEDKYGGELEDARELVMRRASAQRCEFIEAKFYGCRAAGATFAGSNMAGAEFPGTDLCDATLRDSDLTDAKLHEARNLTTSQLGGTILLNAKLPEAIAKWEPLLRVESIVSRASRTLTVLLLTSAYSLVALLVADDADLLTSPKYLNLPSLGVTTTSTDLKYLLPASVLLLFAYFQFYLRSYWRTLSGLPAVFPDGIQLDEKVHPWVFSSLLPYYVERLGGLRTPCRALLRLALEMSLHRLIAVLMAWWLPSIVCLTYWWGYLPLHDAATTNRHLLLAALALTSGASLHVTAVKKMRGARPLSLWFPLGLFGLAAATLAISGSVSQVVPSGRWTSTNLCVEGTKLSTYAAGRTAIRLEGMNLVGMDARDADFRPSDNERVSLAGSRLTRADLRRAKFGAAILDSVILDSADLRGADFSGSDLRGLTITGADMRGTVFSDRSQLDSTVFVCVDLRETVLEGERYRGTRLVGCDLRGTQFGQMVGDMGESTLSLIDLTTQYHDFLRGRGAIVSDSVEYADWLVDRQRVLQPSSVD